MYARIDRAVSQEAREREITVAERKKLRTEIFSSIRRLDVLQALVDDPGVTEIMVNGTEHIFIERAGQLMEYDGTFESKEKLSV